MSSKEAAKYYKDQTQKPRVVQYPVEDRTINYADVGNHPKNAVIFIHGAPGAWSAFADFLKNEKLLGQARLIAVDRPGYGFSNYGVPEVSLQRQCSLMLPLLDTLADYHTILVGHSLGGPVASRLAMDYPQLVDGLVLVAPSIDPELEEKAWYRYVGRSFVGRSMMPGSFWSTNEEIFFLKEQLEAMMPLWQNIKVPTIVIQGDQDNLVPKENAYFAQKMIADEYLEVWMEEGVNHFIPWTHPQLIENAVSQLLGYDNGN